LERIKNRLFQNRRRIQGEDICRKSETEKLKKGFTFKESLTIAVVDLKPLEEKLPKPR